MKIGIICYPTYGGSGVVATELGKSIASRGHEVHFITYRQPIRLAMISSNIFFHEVNTVSYPLFKSTPYEINLASKIVEVTLTEKIDVLHVHYAVPHATSAYLAKKILLSKGIHIPIVTTLHGTDITLVGKDEAYMPVVAFSIEQSDVITAVSNSLMKETYDWFNIKKEIKVIYNFVDLNYFKRHSKQHFRNAIAPDNEKIIAHASNFRLVKRVNCVINMFDKLKKKIPSKLLLIGDGPEKRKMEMLVRDLNIQDDVRFLGKIDELPEVFSVADLFVMPSEKESFGLAALEAMACEVPVIASKIGGLPELVEDGVSGILFNPYDLDAMVKAGLIILEDDSLPQYREAAINRAKLFSTSIIVPQYEELYKNVILKTNKRKLAL